MDNKSKFLVTTIIVLSLLVGALGGFVFFDKIYKTDNNKNEIKEESNDLNEEPNTDNKVSDNSKYYGTYTVKYNDDSVWIENVPSTLTLNSDDSFIFVWNICSGMTEVKGVYNIIDNKIVLSNLTSIYEQETLDLNLDGKTTLEFVIVSENEIYLNLETEMFACTIAGNQNGSFVK